MSNGSQRHSSSVGAVITVVAIVFLVLLGGLVVLGLAGFFFWRLSVPPQVMEPAAVVEERVWAEPAEAVALPAERQAPAAAEAPASKLAVRRITVALDQQGRILADGQPVDRDGLKNLLVKARENGRLRLEVVVDVDHRCLFEHVAAVQSVCAEAGVENVRIGGRSR